MGARDVRPEPQAAAPFPHRGLLVDESTDDYIFGNFENVVLYAWRRHTTPHSLEVASAACVRAQSVGGGRFGLFGVAEESAIVPGRELRDSMGRLIDGQAGSLIASGFAFEGTGFRAATIRSVGIGLSLLMRGAVPHRVFGTKLAGADWLCAELRKIGAPCPDRRGLLDAMEHLRACPSRGPGR